MPTPYPPNIPPHRGGNAETFTRPVKAELIGYAAPQGFGSFREEQRYQEIFDETAETAPGYNYNAYQGGIGGTYYPPHPPFGAVYGEPPKEQAPYEDTVVFFHHGKRGVRLAIQANRKMFVALVILVLIVVNSPGITDLLGGLLKSMLGAR
jgi:hypothetical protein